MPCLFSLSAFFFYFFIYLYFFLPLVLFVKTIPNGEYSSLRFSNTFGLYPNSSPVKYSYLPKRLLVNNVEILAASLLKSYRV